MKFTSNDKNQKLSAMLKEARQDFEFDQSGIKNRLMSELHQIPMEEKAHPGFFEAKAFKFSTMAAVPVIFLSVGFAAAHSQPGDKLFKLNKLGENFVLSLPLPDETQANFHASIVAKRLNSLVRVQSEKSETAAEEAQETIEDLEIETIKESDESLQNAIESITANRNRLTSLGQNEGADKLGAVLNKLEDLAGQQEEQVRTIEASVTQGSNREQIQKHLEQIKNTRNRTRKELELEEIDSD